MGEGVALGSLHAGDELPPLEIPIDTTLIVAGALASRDYTPVHHDRSAAQAAGMSDVFMNILTTNGLVGRYVTDWAGPDAGIERVAVKLGAPNLPGDTMVLAGSVVRVDPAAGRVELEVSGTNSWGEHVSASVTLRLPAGGGR